MLRTNLKQFLIYSIGSVSQTALGFLLLPLYLRQLTAAEYGIVSVLLTLNTLVSLVAGAGIISGLSRLYYEQTPTARRIMTGTVLIWLTGTAMGLAVAMFVAAAPLSIVLFGESNYSTEVQIAGILLAVSAVQAGLYNFLRLEKRPGAFVAISISGLIADLALKLYLIGIEHLGIEGYFISSVLSIAVTTAAAAVVVRGSVRLAVDRNMLRDLLTLGFPFIFSGFGMWVLDISDRLILNAFAGPGPVGIYSVGYKFASIFNIVLLGPLSLFWIPFIFSYGAEKGEQAMGRVSQQAFVLFALAGSLLLVAIGTGSPDLIRLFARDSAYQSAAAVVPFLSLAPFLYMLTYPAGAAILQSKQVRYSSYAMVAAALVNVSLNLVLIPRFSFYGATATTVIGYVVLCVLQYYWAQRVFPTRYDWLRGAKIIACAAAGVIISSLIGLETPLMSLIVREAVGVVCFGTLVWLVGGIRPADIRHLYHLAFPASSSAAFSPRPEGE